MLRKRAFVEGFLDVLSKEAQGTPGLIGIAGGMAGQMAVPMALQTFDQFATRGARIAAQEKRYAREKKIKERELAMLRRAAAAGRLR